jgi:hypothetical protein
MGAPKLTYYPQLEVEEKNPVFFKGVLEKSKPALKNRLNPKNSLKRDKIG